MLLIFVFEFFFIAVDIIENGAITGLSMVIPAIMGVMLVVLQLVENWKNDRA